MSTYQEKMAQLQGGAQPPTQPQPPEPQSYQQKMQQLQGGAPSFEQQQPQQGYNLPSGPIPSEGRVAQAAMRELGYIPSWGQNPRMIVDAYRTIKATPKDMGLPEWMTNQRDQIEQLFHPLFAVIEIAANIHRWSGFTKLNFAICGNATPGGESFKCVAETVHKKLIWLIGKSDACPASLN